MCKQNVTDSMDPPTFAFEKMGFENRYFMINMSDTLSIVAIVSMIIPVISILKLLLPSNNFTTKADNFIKGRFLITIVNITYLKVAFTAFLNFSSFDVSTPNNTFNSLASAFGICYCILVPGFYIF